MAKKKAKSSHRPDATDKEEPDFETSMSRVEKIVAQLESGELGLSESLRQYEAGIRELKRSHRVLEAAEQKVTLLSGFDADGNPVTEPMKPGEKRTGTGRSSATRRSTADPADDSRELF